MATSRKIILKTGVCVSCPTCACEIPVLTAQSLPREFSVLCPSCGGRKFYQVTQVHDEAQDAKKTQISARMQFGMRGTIDYDQTAGKSMPPKSRLSELASWLVQ